MIFKAAGFCKDREKTDLVIESSHKDRFYDFLFNLLDFAPFLAYIIYEKVDIRVLHMDDKQ